MDIAIIGYGTVGSGVAEIINSNNLNMKNVSSADDLNIKYILDLRDFPDDINKNKFIKDFNIILEDPIIKVVVETMGGINPAFDFTCKCLKKGKSVVSSNKELVAEKGFELLSLAKKNNVNYFFEASVGGGIPIVRPLSQCLAANKIEEITGILNGTTNFIFSKMIKDKMSFEEALHLAQKNGYAEKDPTDDIEGNDAARKICILASLCFGHHVYPKYINSEGISKVTLEDVSYAESFNAVIKLIATAKLEKSNKISLIVAPMLVSKNHQLAFVDDVFNAILVRGDSTGDVVFYGKGAGKLPTASAVVADIIDCSNHITKRKNFGWDAPIENYVSDFKNRSSSIYVRLKTNHVYESLVHIERLFGKIENIRHNKSDEEEFAFITPTLNEDEIYAKLSELKNVNILATLRCLDF